MGFKFVWCGKWMGTVVVLLLIGIPGMFFCEEQLITTSVPPDSIC